MLSFLEPKDLLQAAQTCRYWRILAEDNLLWREKCKEDGDFYKLCDFGNSSLNHMYIVNIWLYIMHWIISVTNKENICFAGIDEPLHIKRRKVIKPGFTHSPWKSAYIRQHRIDTNWRRGDLKSPKVECCSLLTPNSLVHSLIVSYKVVFSSYTPTFKEITNDYAQSERQSK